VASPRIVTISWGIEDLGAAMGLPRVRDERGKYLDIPRSRGRCARSRRPPPAWTPSTRCSSTREDLVADGGSGSGGSDLAGKSMPRRLALAAQPLEVGDVGDTVSRASTPAADAAIAHIVRA